MPYDNMVECIDFCAKHGLVLMADEVYQENIWDGGRPFHSFKKVRKWGSPPLALLWCSSSRHGPDDSGSHSHRVVPPISSSARCSTQTHVRASSFFRVPPWCLRCAGADGDEPAAKPAARLLPLDFEGLPRWARLARVRQVPRAAKREAVSRRVRSARRLL